MKKITKVFVIFLALMVGAVEAQERIAVNAGDSITWQAMREFKVATLAMPGATAESLMRRLNRLLPEDADVVAIMIGINNLLNGQTAGETANKIQDLLVTVRIKAPMAEIMLESVLPTRAGGKLNLEVVGLNQMLVEMAEEMNIKFLNFHQYFCEDDGLTGRKELVRDRNVHLTKGGKQLLYELLEDNTNVIH